MLRKRGYDSFEETILNKTVKLKIKATASGKTTDTFKEAQVYFVEKVKVGIDIIKHIFSCQEPHAIIIYNISLTTEAKQIINKIKYIEAFTFDEMGFPLDDCIPKYHIYFGKITEANKLPKINDTEIVVRRYKFPVGTILYVNLPNGPEFYLVKKALH